MGGAKFMGRDRGIPYSKELRAFEYFWYWFIGGLPLCFGLYALIFSKFNLVFPVSVYGLGIIFLWTKYIKIEKRDLKK